MWILSKQYIDYNKEIESSEPIWISFTEKKNELNNSSKLAVYTVWYLKNISIIVWIT